MAKKNDMVDDMENGLGGIIFKILRSLTVT